MECITRAARRALPILLTAAAAPLAGAEPMDEQALRSHLQQALPQFTLDAVRPAPIPGLYEVLAGSEVWYVTDDGQHLLEGNIYDLQTRHNLTEAARKEVRANVLARYDAGSLLVYPADGPPLHTITVVTDIDCVFCQRLHAHIDELQELGVEVRYLLSPRAGLDSGSYRKAVSVWCADDPQDALTRAKRREDVERRECANPVEEHMNLALSLGTQSTPTIFQPDGTMIRGYRPPRELLALLSH